MGDSLSSFILSCLDTCLIKFFRSETSERRADLSHILDAVVCENRKKKIEDDQ